MQSKFEQVVGIVMGLAIVAVIMMLALCGCHKKTIRVEDPVPAQFVTGAKYVKIIFHPGSAKLAGQGLFEVLNNINVLRANKVEGFRVIGHACDAEGEEACLKLAKARGEAVVKALWNFGIDTDGVKVKAEWGPVGVDCGYVEISEK